MPDLRGGPHRPSAETKIVTVATSTTEVFTSKAFQSVILTKDSAVAIRISVGYGSTDPGICPSPSTESNGANEYLWAGDHPFVVEVLDQDLDRIFHIEARAQASVVVGYQAYA